MRLRGRVRRLTGEARRRGLESGSGCPACRARKGLPVFVSSRELPDGTTEPEGDWPAPCPACGEVPEFLTEVVERVVAPESGEDSGPCI